MSLPCPFCGFEASDFRESYNWRCGKCGKDYAGWLIDQKARASSPRGATHDNARKNEPLFSRQNIPSEAEPVKFAQSLFVLAILLLLVMSFVIEGIFSWVFPVSIPLVGYYAFTMHKTGYAISQHAVYHRDRNAIMYRVHLWAAVAYIFLASGVWFY